MSLAGKLGTEHNTLAYQEVAQRQPEKGQGIQ